MKKRILALLLAAVLLLVACAKAPTWQEQYDLGMRYLSESNYQEAVIAFAAAIAIDEKRPEAYEGLADAYLQSGDLAKAREALQQGLAATGDERFQARLDALDAPDLEPSGGEDTTIEDEGQGDSFFWENYRPPEDFTTEEQQLIDALANAALAGDFDAIRAVAEDVAGLNGCCTVWQDYKIRIFYIFDSNQDASAPMAAGVEMRPENGTGYYVTAYFATTPSNGMAYGDCEDWQWNGEYTQTLRAPTVLADGTVQPYTRTMTGTIQSNLFQGTFAGTEQRGEEAAQRFEEVYQDGAQVDYRQYADGELVYSWDDETRQMNAGLFTGPGKVLYTAEQLPMVYW